MVAFPGRSCLGIILNDGGFIIEVIFVGIGDAKMVAKLIACPEPFAADITLDILGAVGIARLGCFTGRAEMIAENVPRFKPLAAVGALGVFDAAVGLRDIFRRGESDRMQHFLQILSSRLFCSNIIGKFDQQDAPVAERNADILRHSVISVGSFR